jgi:regulator of sigma E protease
LRDQKRKNQVTINNDGVLGVKLAGLSFASMEKLGYYKVSQQEFGF